MRAIIKNIARSLIIRCQRGATAVEYALIIALMVLVMISALKTVATKTNSMWTNVATEVLAH